MSGRAHIGQWFGCAGDRSSANSKFHAKLHKVHQYLSSDSIIEICPPGGKKSGRLKVLSGRFGNRIHGNNIIVTFTQTRHGRNAASQMRCFSWNLRIFFYSKVYVL